jgi:carboxymethylenebutenolidase
MSVSESQQFVDVEGGRLPTLILQPDRQNGPAVIVLGEIWAVNPQIRALCRRLAEAGFPVVAPDLYRGQHIPPSDAPQDKLNDAFTTFPDIRAIRDCRELARRIMHGEFGFAAQRPSVWGFCMGGRFAHYLGALCADVSRVVNFYGRLNFPRTTAKPFTPLDVAGLIQVPYLGVFAEHDGLIPIADVDALSSILDEGRIEREIRVFKGSHHGFMNETRPAYDADAAATAWDLALCFLRRGDGAHKP